MMFKKIILHIGHENNPHIRELEQLHKAVRYNQKMQPSKDGCIQIISPMSLKTRIDQYQYLKRYGVPIIAVFYPQTLEQTLKHPWTTNASESQKDDLQYKKEQFARLQPPVLHVDCDDIQLSPTYNQGSMRDNVLQYRDKHPRINNHSNPHHKETISEHIMLVAEELIKMTVQGKIGVDQINQLHTTALYHDLGKYWTKQINLDTQSATYYNHENVSAMIFVTDMLLKEKDNDFFCSNNLEQHRQFTKNVTQVILNHMIAKTKDYTPKIQRRRHLTDYELNLLNLFTKADNNGRIK